MSAQFPPSPGDPSVCSSVPQVETQLWPREFTKELPHLTMEGRVSLHSWISYDFDCECGVGRDSFVISV